MGEKNVQGGFGKATTNQVPCRAGSTSLYLICCVRRASQMQLVHLLEVSLLNWCIVVFGWSLGVLRGQLVSHELITCANSALIVNCVRNPVPPFLGQAHVPSASSTTGTSCHVCPCSAPPDQLSQWARGGLWVVSLGHALTFQSLAKLALANK